MNIASAIEYAIIGLFIALAVVIVLTNIQEITEFFEGNENYKVLISAAIVTAVIWIGFICSIIYQWIFMVKGGYESRKRPCIKEIVRKYRLLLESERRSNDVSEKRLYRLAYYSWAYSQEKVEGALSETVIQRISKSWKRIHFLGANFASLLIGIIIILISMRFFPETRATISWIVVITYFIFSLMFYLRWKQEVRHITRLERFIVEENWEHLESFLRKVDSIRVERY